MARQIGTVLGLAGLIAILVRVGQADSIAIFGHGVVLAIVFFVAAGAVSATLLRPRPATASQLR